jgi:hypothetical protein
MSIELDCGRWGNPATEEFYLRQFIDWFTEYRDARSLEISFDAAIFDDGELIGPNECELDQHFAAYVEEKQDFYKSIVRSLDSGMSLDQALAPVEAAMRANAPDRILDSRRLGKRWPSKAAAEVRSWRRKYGDEAAPELYRRAVRTEPFAIHGATVAVPLSHVVCPRCHRSPKSADRWPCKCGHRWNTFDTRGLCPACGHQWQQTACLMCGESSPHADWYIGE